MSKGGLLSWPAEGTAMLVLKRWAMKPKQRLKQSIPQNRSSTAPYSGMVPV